MTHFALYVVGKSVLSIAQLWAHMTPDQIRLAVAVRIDGETARAVAEREGVSRSTVARALRVLRKTLTRFDAQLPPPAQAKTRHVRQIPGGVLRSL